VNADQDREVHEVQEQRETIQVMVGQEWSDAQDISCVAGHTSKYSGNNPISDSPTVPDDREDWDSGKSGDPKKGLQRAGTARDAIRL
jgi:hypothetical protein